MRHSPLIWYLIQPDMAVSYSDDHIFNALSTAVSSTFVTFENVIQSTHSWFEEFTITACGVQPSRRIRLLCSRLLRRFLRRLLRQIYCTACMTKHYHLQGLVSQSQCTVCRFSNLTGLPSIWSLISWDPRRGEHMGRVGFDPRSFFPVDGHPCLIPVSPKNRRSRGQEIGLGSRNLERADR